MEQVLKLSKQAKIKDVKRYSVSYIASVMWLVYALVIAYVNAFFYDTDLPFYYIELVLMLAILFYQFYYLVKDINLLKSKLNLVVIYCIFIAVHYLLLRSGLERVVCLVALIFSLLTIKKYPFKKKEIKYLYRIFLLAVFLKIINGATVENMSDESKFNPNECAIYLMLMFCISIIMYAFEKRKRYVFIALISFALQFIFTSRGATVGCLLFFIFFIAFKAWKRECRVKTAFFIIFILSMLSVLAAYFYSTVLYNAIGPGKIIILGKDLFTGRQEIWQLTFESINENMWFGVGSHVNESTILEAGNEVYRNAHNMALAIWVSFGLIHFILFYLLFSHLIATNGAFKKGKYKNIHLAPFVFMTVITLMNYFEVLFFSKWALPVVLVAYGLICNCCWNKGKASLKNTIK